MQVPVPVPKERSALQRRLEAWHRDSHAQTESCVALRAELERAAERVGQQKMRIDEYAALLDRFPGIVSATREAWHHLLTTPLSGEDLSQALGLETCNAAEILHLSTRVLLLARDRKMPVERLWRSLGRVCNQIVSGPVDARILGEVGKTLQTGKNVGAFHPGKLAASWNALFADIERHAVLSERARASLRDSFFRVPASQGLDANARSRVASTLSKELEGTELLRRRVLALAASH